MSQAEAQRRVIESLGDPSVLSPEGSARVQVKEGTAYVAIPARLANFYEIEQSTEVARAFDPASGCLITVLNSNVALFE